MDASVSSSVMHHHEVRLRQPAAAGSIASSQSHRVSARVGEGVAWINRGAIRAVAKIPLVRLRARRTIGNERTAAQNHESASRQS